ncbi:MAG: hypothetical protein IPJ76_08165 [Flavobacteriales bacterium]|nr:MAG: hypothetical protein IPJ76_08165 [Flavobacteriales bacterium]
MIRSMLFSAAFAPAVLTASAQQATYKADHRFAYSNVLLENSVVKVEMEDILAEVTYCKFRFRVTNKTNDYVFVDPTKFKVKMGDAAIAFQEKPYMIRPYEKEGKTLNMTGATNYHMESFSIDFADGFQRAASKGNAVAVEDGALPAAKNELSGGPFTVNLQKADQETKITIAKYNVKYVGSSLAIVDPSKVSVRIPSGQVFATTKSKSKPVVLNGGEEDNFTVTIEIPGKIADMQFTTLTVLWNDCMVETSKEKLAVDAANVTVDQARTTEINK